MPEGDSIRQVCERLRPLLEGEVVEDVRCRWPEQARGLVGRRLLSLEPIGKQLLLHFDDDTTLRTHLGMKGRWRVASRRGAAELSPAALGLLLETRHGRCALLYPKVVERFEARRRALHPILSKLGPDLLADAFDGAEVLRRARWPELSDADAAELLLDQRVACGIGNVYKSEVLFLEGVHPWTAVRALDDDGVRRLYDRARELMRANLESPRRNTTGRVSPRLWVYGARRRSCLRCGGRVQAEMQGSVTARVTWWCPRCQAG
jgi:endonuclease-8